MLTPTLVAKYIFCKEVPDANIASIQKIAAVNVQIIMMGNILAIAPIDTLQLVIISFPSLLVLSLKWKDLMVTFFDETHAKMVGLNTERLKVLFFIILSLSSVAAMQTVGAFLVIALLVTPGATAYLLTDKFQNLIILSVSIGSCTCFGGAYLSFFVNGATGGLIVVLQTMIFLTVFFFAPKHGYMVKRIRIKKRLRDDHD